VDELLLNQFLLLGAVLFCLGVYGVLARRNAVLVLMSIEPILNAVNINLVALGATLAVGAMGFREDASYSGIGPAFYPGAVAALLALCGVALLREAMTGGFRNLAPPTTALPGAWRGFALVSGSLLASAFLITRAGFPITCALLFTVVAAAFGSRRPLRDLAIGAVVSLILHWIFAKGLGLMLPSLTAGGWV